MILIFKSLRGIPLMNVGRTIPIGRCDTLPICVQSPAWWNGQEGSRDDRLAVFGFKQFWAWGTATLERYADREAADAGATLALAAASLRHPRVSQVEYPSTGFIVDTTTPARDDFASSARQISHGRQTRISGEEWPLAAGLRREESRLFPLISRSETIVYCPVEQRKSIFQSICQSQIRARTRQIFQIEVIGTFQLFVCLLNSLLCLEDHRH